MSEAISPWYEGPLDWESEPPPEDVEAAPRRLLADRLLDRGALASLPVATPLISKVLDLHTVALLAGYWGTGKSFLAQDFAACVATGKPWQGRATTQGNVLYIASEGAYGLHGRLSTWETAWQRRIDPEKFLVLPMPVQITQTDQLAELVGIVKNLRPKLLVIDTVARCAVGLDENSSKDMGRFVDSLYRLRDATGEGTVLAVHHTGKDKLTVRGSSALEAGVDTVYTIEADGLTLKLDRKKRKDGPTPDTHLLKLASVAGCESVILESQGFGTAPSTNGLLSQFESQFSATGASGATLRLASDLSKTSFYRSLNALVNSGELTNTGTKQRPFYELADGNE
jgi:hypothetical protein